MVRLLAIPVLLLGVVALPGRPAEPAADPIPAKLRDPAFERFVDLALVRTALTRRDPSLLCDVALQLAEGERILFRSHLGLPASRLFRITLEVAVEKRDRASLDRLEKAARASGDKDLLARVELSKKLASASRRIDTTLLSAGESMSVEGLVLYRSFIDQIKLATTLRDRAKLEDMEKGIDDLPELQAPQRQALRKLVQEAKRALPAAATGGDAEGDDLLRKLVSSSRSLDRKGDKKRPPSSVRDKLEKLLKKP